MLDLQGRATIPEAVVKAATAPDYALCSLMADEAPGGQISFDQFVRALAALRSQQGEARFECAIVALELQARDMWQQDSQYRQRSRSPSPEGSQMDQLLGHPMATSELHQSSDKVWRRSTRSLENTQRIDDCQVFGGSHIMPITSTVDTSEAPALLLLLLLLLLALGVAHSDDHPEAAATATTLLGAAVHLGLWGLLLPGVHCIWALQNPETYLGATPTHRIALRQQTLSRLFSGFAAMQVLSILCGTPGLWMGAEACAGFAVVDLLLEVHCTSVWEGWDVRRGLWLARRVAMIGAMLFGTPARWTGRSALLLCEVVSHTSSSESLIEWPLYARRIAGTVVVPWVVYQSWLALSMDATSGADRLVASLEGLVATALVICHLR